MRTGHTGAFLGAQEDRLTTSLAPALARPLPPTTPARTELRHSQKVYNALRPHWVRAIVYAVLAAVMWISLVYGATLVIVAILLTICAILYALAALKKEPHPENMLGGAGSGAATTAPAPAPPAAGAAAAV